MPLDPTIASLAEGLSHMQATEAELLDATALRVRLDTLATMANGRPEWTPQVGSTEDVVLPDGRAARIYRPDGAEGPVPTVLFIHGGGFVIGSVETHDNQARELCRRVGAVVVSVDYRLAPEQPFPAAAEDSLASLEWVGAHVGTLGGDAGRIGVAGDSAGGNLAAVVAQSRTVPLAAQLLIYPVVDARDVVDYPSRVEHAEDGVILTERMMRWFHEQYAAVGDDVRASPVLGADLSGLPAAVIVTAEYDPLRDEGEHYGALLEKAGVTVTVRRFDGLMHGFFGLGSVSPACAAAIEETCSLFRELLG